MTMDYCLSIFVSNSAASGATQTLFHGLSFANRSSSIHRVECIKSRQCSFCPSVRSAATPSPSPTESVSHSEWKMEIFCATRRSELTLDQLSGHIYFLLMSWALHKMSYYVHKYLHLTQGVRTFAINADFQIVLDQHELVDFAKQNHHLRT